MQLFNKNGDAVKVSNDQIETLLSSGWTKIKPMSNKVTNSTSKKPAPKKDTIK